MLSFYLNINNLKVFDKKLIFWFNSFDLPKQVYNID